MLPLPLVCCLLIFFAGWLSVAVAQYRQPEPVRTVVGWHGSRGGYFIIAWGKL